jgi:2-oxoglutarate dehydrogenase E2 component (dihydrolipoamide succinyltransferase)
MAVELKVPSLGESVTQAQVGQWIKKEGDAVVRDEPVVEVESEKATVAVPAPASGVLRRVLRQTGETVAVGQPLGEIEEGAVAAASAAPPAAPAKEAPRAVVPPPPPPPPKAAAPLAPPQAAPIPPAGDVRLTPAARKLLAEKGLGKADVLRLLEAASSGKAALAPVDFPPPGERERLVPMSPLRRTVARRLLEAQESAAILTTFNEADMSRVMDLRDRYGAAFQERHGIKLGFMGFFVKAAVEALAAFPSVNAEVRGDAVLFKDHYDVGVAVGGGKGLVVPVIRDADQLSLAQIELSIVELAKRARENRITMEDLSGGTFTISNGGIYGSMLSTPILNTPQSGILGLHKIQKKPVVGPDDTVVVRPMMYLALSYDHRIIDGREAVGFLVKVKELIEEPSRLMLDV